MKTCETEIYLNGGHVAVLGNMTGEMTSERIESVVKQAAIISGQKMDWHYVGGRADVLCIGDIQKARKALDDMKLGADIC